MNLRKTNEWIYYIYDYAPKYQWDWRNRSKKAVRLSENILQYKNMKEPAFTSFVDDLSDGIIELSNEILTENIALVGIPKSAVGVESPVCKSIKAILEDLEYIEDEDGYTQTLLDYSTLLRRIRPLPSAHSYRGREKRTYEQLKSSLRCSQSDLSDPDTSYIILDDITTEGLSMEVARDILVEHGADEDNIYALVLARTANRYEPL